MKTHGRLMLVEDDEVFNRVLARALSRRGFIVDCARTLRDAQDRLARSDAEAPDHAVIDLNLEGESGLKLIRHILDANPRCRILILTGYASITTAVDAIKLGATHYLAKPADIDTIVKALLDDAEPDTDTTPEQTLSVSRLEWEHIQRVLTENEQNISATARALKMHRRTLQRKLMKKPARE